MKYKTGKSRKMNTDLENHRYGLKQDYDLNPTSCTVLVHILGFQDAFNSFFGFCFAGWFSVSTDLRPSAKLPIWGPIFCRNV